MKNLTFLFLFVLISNGLISQKIVFDSPKTLSKESLAKPGYLINGDLNSDGFDDVVIASGRNESLFWFKNKNGVFGGLNTICTDFDRIGLLQLADLDKDGDLDIVVGSSRGRILAWFENLDGKGNFSDKKIIYDKSDGMTVIVLEDINRDGNIDILVSYWEGNQLVYFINNGNGTFSDKNVIDEGIGIYGLCVADIDGDSKRDILVSFANNNKIVCYKSLDGVGAYSDYIIVDSTVIDPRSLMATDIDSDGDNDLFCLSGKEMIWYENIDGQGDLGNKKQLLDFNKSAKVIIAKDIDNDGDDDIVVGHSEDGEVIWFENKDGQGDFSEEKVIIDDFEGAYGICVSDFDKNNTQDICAASYYGSKLVWMKNTNANFGTPIIIEEADIKRPEEMVTGDFDGDGDLDVVLGCDYEDNLVLYKNNGASFNLTSIYTDDDAYNRIIDKADIDGDGDLDVLTAINKWTNFLLVWYENDGSGNFVIKDTIDKNQYDISDFEPRDIDNDGDIDIVITSVNDNSVGWYKNDGNGNFSSQIYIMDALEKASEISINDLDRDGDLDIIAISNRKSKIVYFYNKDGKGNFSDGEIIENTKSYPSLIHTVDLDSDGDNDILYSSSGDNSLFWHKNLDGNGNFGEAIKLTDFYLVNQDYIVPYDLDSDGDIDIVIGKESYESIKWLENTDGKGKFGRINNVLDDISYLEEVLVGDIDGDSRKDVIYISSDENKLIWSKNLIAPIYSKHPDDFEICDTGTINFNVEFDFADSIRWHLMRSYDNYFSPIKDDDSNVGATSKSLQVKVSSSYQSGTRYKCMIYYKNVAFSSDTALLTVYKLVQANTVQDFSTCYDSAYIYGNYPSDGTGKWSIQKGFADIEVTDTNYTKIKNINSGENIFRWTITNGLCVDYDEVIVVKKDSVIITKQPVDVEVVSGSTINFEVIASGDIAVYQWYKNGYKLVDGDNVSGSTTTKLILKDVKTGDKGDYWCKITGNCNIAQSKSANLKLITGTQELGVGKIMLYPNPVSDIFIVDFKDSKIANAKVTLYNYSGKEVLEVYKKLDNKIVRINIENFNSGLYYIKIESNQFGISYWKVIVSK